MRCMVKLVHVCKVPPPDSFFASGRVQRSLAPKILLCWDLRDNAKLVGIANVCYFASEEALGTETITRAYCERHRWLPNFEAHWFFLDVFCSIRSPWAKVVRFVPPLVVGEKKEIEEALEKLGGVVSALAQ